MESLNTYETSLKELTELEKRTSMDIVTINVNRLDGETKNQILMALRKVIKTRKNAVIDVIQGAR